MSFTTQTRILARERMKAPDGYALEKAAHPLGN
jgi:hypothetical protein